MPVEKVVIQQGERSSGGRNDCVFGIGCDEDRNHRARFSALSGDECRHELNRGEKRAFRMGECFRVLFELDAGGYRGRVWGHWHQFLRVPSGDLANMEAESDSGWEAIAAVNED